mmetsp:Transcript_28275/g.49727  ORF Transcript_28275/g.49727 Transcript_28275/m.49727 type:complete len:97 (-) Transcript_28275:196-486(-)
MKRLRERTALVVDYIYVAEDNFWPSGCVTSWFCKILSSGECSATSSRINRLLIPKNCDKRSKVLDDVLFRIEEGVDLGLVQYQVNQKMATIHNHHD